MKKRGQMQISFGMIFSILLIMAFIAFVIYIIIYFLNFSNRVKIEQFEDELQKHVDGIRAGYQGSKVVNLGLPKKIKKVCFIDNSQPAKGVDRDMYNDFIMINTVENVMYFPEGSSEGKEGFKLNYINISNITGMANPYCVENKKGKVSLMVQMKYEESLVRITGE